uniref:Uncharacterized protein LOC100372275 isoform X2 n=1 Tax=Saccoglossus kowalevskii TaxID=10224 RepID=A0ABM0MBJ0_SACKO|nr:PREDICTED: uncharacterized protein LOC100372275 isoform X2 [Saccoglossus kowalevskii]
MATRFIAALIFVINFILITANEDLRAEQFEITNELIPEYRPAEDTSITLDLIIKNVGDIDLHSSPEEIPHFYAQAYLADNVEEENAHQKSEHFNLTITDANVFGAFPQQTKVNLTAITGTIKVDAEHCLHYTHMCVQIYPNKTDKNMTNDDFCLKVGVPPPGGVGNLFCTDLVIDFFNITSPTAVTYKAGVEEKITASIGVKNLGAVDLPFEEASSHWGIDLYLQGPEASIDLGYVRVKSGEREKPHQAFYGRNHPENPSNVVTVNDVALEVLLDKNNCEKYQELCLRLLPSVTARSDSMDDDEERCLAFNSMIVDGGAGMKNCTIKQEPFLREVKTNHQPEQPAGAAMTTVSLIAVLFSVFATKFI